MSERPVNPKPESLDDIIGHSAVVLADQIQKAAAWAKSEMDLQIEVAGVRGDEGAFRGRRYVFVLGVPAFESCGEEFS